ncbi:hypothetical protein [Glycomyces sp. NPDC021274]|jgi:hypothetical protein|uniref:hypothetical protein n=1 Tax=Glycomyces sp. NPDC021274 TaxID=3155120 RepID=UPI0033FA80F1
MYLRGKHFIIGITTFVLITLALLGLSGISAAAAGNPCESGAACVDWTEAAADGDLEARRGGSNSDTDSDSRGSTVVVVFGVGCVGLVILLIIIAIVNSLSDTGRRD